MPERRRLPRGSLTPDVIVDAALRYIDEHGLPALTIRGVAAELGATPMALYRHFSDKQELLDAVLDAVIAGFRPPRVPANATWREQLVAYFTATRATLVAHPGVAQLIAAGPSSTPATLRWTDTAIGLLRSAGLDAEAAVAAYTALVLHAAGFAQWELAEADENRREQRIADVAALSTDYPNVRAVRSHLRKRATSRQFRFGLDRFLDGIEAYRLRPGGSRLPKDDGR